MGMYDDTNLVTIDPSECSDRTVQLVGFDAGLPYDELRAALRLLGGWQEASPYGGDYDFEGVLGLVIDGERHDWILRVDPSDGYRSHLAPIVSAPIESAVMQFTHSPLDVKLRVIEREGDNADVDGWELIDGDGHVWLRFGTANIGDYYPSGFVSWHPKEQR